MRQFSLKGLVIAIGILGAAMATIESARADSTCSAKNDNGGTCSVSCVNGQTAACQNSSGSYPPICQCSGSLGAFLVNQPVQSERREIALVSKDDCLIFPGTGTSDFVPVQNVCRNPLKFTMIWAGNSPAKSFTYRINQLDTRLVRRRDLQGQIASHGPTGLGLGPTTNVSISARPLNGQQTGLFATHSNPEHTYFEAAISIMKGGKEIQKCGGASAHEGVVVPPIAVPPGQGHWPFCVFSPANGETFIQESVQAEKDPD